MWLINAANEQTKAAVASYFNPVKLIDRNASRKGLEDVGDGPHAAGIADGGRRRRRTARPAPTARRRRRWPQARMRTELRRHEGTHRRAPVRRPLCGAGRDRRRHRHAAEHQRQGRRRRADFRPGDRRIRRRSPIAIPSRPTSGRSRSSTPRRADARRSSPERGRRAPKRCRAAAGRRKPVPDAAQRGRSSRTAGTEAAAARGRPRHRPKAEPDASRRRDRQGGRRRDPRRNSPRRSARTTSSQEGISVVATDKGVMISVTDQLDFGMFEIGSAVPRRELVLAMEKIGKVLAGQKGTHRRSAATPTHGRSGARPTTTGGCRPRARTRPTTCWCAAGLDEKRITEVAGFADRKLKVTADPLAAANRRIEILLDARRMTTPVSGLAACCALLAAAPPLPRRLAGQRGTALRALPDGALAAARAGPHRRRRPRRPADAAQAAGDDRRAFRARDEARGLRERSATSAPCWSTP